MTETNLVIPKSILHANSLISFMIEDTENWFPVQELVLVPLFDQVSGNQKFLNQLRNIEQRFMSYVMYDMFL